MNRSCGWKTIKTNSLFFSRTSCTSLGRIFHNDLDLKLSEVQLGQELKLHDWNWAGRCLKLTTHTVTKQSIMSNVLFPIKQYILKNIHAFFTYKCNGEFLVTQPICIKEEVYEKTENFSRFKISEYWKGVHLLLKVYVVLCSLSFN